MTPFSEILDGMTGGGEAFTVTVPPDWMQGRTTYGGLSSALCVAAAERMAPGLPPLRAGQFTFIGPAGGAVRLQLSVLRQGKNSVFIGADLIGEAGLATRAVLTFGAARASELNHAACPLPRAIPRDESVEYFSREGAPAFTKHFDSRPAGGHAMFSGAAAADLLVWGRHKDPAARNTATGLVALGDILPPAAVAMFTRFAPISSMTWGIEMTAPGHVGDPEGWYLLQSTGEATSDGYSSQDMRLWAEDGTLVMASRQMVAVFL